MLLQEEFWNLSNRLGLEDHEIDMAYLIWSRAEDAMQGKPLQKPRLLTKDSQKGFMDKKTSTFHLTGTVNDSELSKSEMQFLTMSLKTTLNNLEEYNKRLKNIAQAYWLQCDKEDDSTSDTFNTLKQCLNLKSKVKKDTKKIATIQSKLKKQISK